MNEACYQTYNNYIEKLIPFLEKIEKDLKKIIKIAKKENEEKVYFSKCYENILSILTERKLNKLDISQIISYNEDKQSFEIKILKTYELNEDILSIYNEIKESSDFLFRNQDKLKNNEKLMLENLNLKVLPEIMNNYLVIDVKDRTKITNSEGKNANELLIESLGNILKKYNDISLVVKEDQIRNLSVMNRYTKQM